MNISLYCHPTILQPQTKAKQSIEIIWRSFNIIRFTIYFRYFIVTKYIKQLFMNLNYPDIPNKRCRKNGHKMIKNEVL